MINDCLKLLVLNKKNKRILRDHFSWLFFEDILWFMRWISYKTTRCPPLEKKTKNKKNFSDKNFIFWGKEVSLRFFLKDVRKICKNYIGKKNGKLEFSFFWKRGYFWIWDFNTRKKIEFKKWFNIWKKENFGVMMLILIVLIR